MMDAGDDMNIFYIKRNDTSPAIQMSLSTRDGPVDLSGATVYFHMRGVTTSIATILSESEGKVRYDWAPSDTQKAGYFHIEWEVVYADGKKETFPNDGFSTVKITADIGEPI